MIFLCFSVVRSKRRGKKKKLFLFVCLIFRMGSLENLLGKSFNIILMYNHHRMLKFSLKFVFYGTCWGLALLWWHAKMPKTIFWCGCCLLCFADGVSSVHFYFSELDYERKFLFGELLRLHRVYIVYMWPYTLCINKHLRFMSPYFVSILFMH